MCGVIGVSGVPDASRVAYLGLYALQHRGQESAGIMAVDEATTARIHREMGLVADAFSEPALEALHGDVAIGHTRYSTAGSTVLANAQPFLVNYHAGPLAVAHNGNLVNADVLREELVRGGAIFSSNSDTEVLINVLAHELEQAGRNLPLTPEEVFKAVGVVHKRVKGSYAVVALIAGFGLLAFRDPYGIRPLCFGSAINGDGKEYMVASESVALEGTGHHLERDVAPGEAIFIDLEGTLHARQCAESPTLNPCMFEFVYLARPDSVIDGVSVYQARLNMGVTLAQRLISTIPPNEIDVVIPIPESSRPSAMQLAQKIGKPYREGFVKNRYVGRTFIMPGQGVRKKSVRQKLNAIGVEFKGRNVLLVDDSIVRGTTSKEIVQMARDAGANKVYMASAAPPVRYPNVYGIDMPTSEELIAHNRSLEEIRAYIGADALIYQDVEAMKRVVNALNTNIRGFEASCFDGVYVTGDVTAADFETMKAQRAAQPDEEDGPEHSRLALGGQGPQA